VKLDNSITPYQKIKIAIEEDLAFTATSLKRTTLILANLCYTKQN